MRLLIHTPTPNHYTFHRYILKHYCSCKEEFNCFNIVRDNKIHFILYTLAYLPSTSKDIQNSKIMQISFRFDRYSIIVHLIHMAQQFMAMIFKIHIYYKTDTCLTRYVLMIRSKCTLYTWSSIIMQLHILLHLSHNWISCPHYHKQLL